MPTYIYKSDSITEYTFTTLTPLAKSLKPMTSTSDLIVKMTPPSLIIKNKKIYDFDIIYQFLNHGP